MIGFHPPIHEPPERIPLTCALGLRFLDVAAGALVGADVAVEPLGRTSLGLRAAAWPLNAPRQRRAGTVTPSGVVAFHGLPGMRELERSSAQDPWDDAPPPREFQIEVTDQMGRFLPCTFTVTAPQQGLAHFAEDGSPPWIEAGAVPLFSAPARPIPGGIAVIRAELRDLASEKPAAWALVEASYSSGGSLQTARGLADDAGRLLLMFAYPEGQRRPYGASPPGNARSLSDQEWNIKLAFFHDAIAPVESAADYGRRLAQPAAAAAGGPSPLTILTETTLRFGQECSLGVLDLFPA
jgi:hypothetical protein